MTARDLGLALIWIGTLLVAGVAIRRSRQGAWSAEAFDRAPPRPGWMVPVTALGLALAAAGLGLMVWGLA